MTADLSGANGVAAGDAAMANFRTAPGYEWMRQEGIRAIENSAAANGMLQSGATLKALQDRGQGLADQSFGQYYNRLAGLSQMGQASAAGVGAQGNQVAAGQAQTDVSAAGTQASMYNQGAQGIGTAINQYGNNSMYERRTNALYQPQQQWNSTYGGNQSYFQNAPVVGYG